MSLSEQKDSLSDCSDMEVMVNSSGTVLPGVEGPMIQYESELERKCMEDYIPSNRSAGKFCPRIFDKWLCWNETEAGMTAAAPCPDFIPGFFPDRFAHKICLEDGTWFRHPDSNSVWSNYTTCVDHADYEWRRFIICFYEVGYFISVVALIISLVIFCGFKCLECTRVRIHKHLFVSFIINNLLWLAWYRLVVNDPYVLLNNPLWCQVLHVFVQYFLVANYFWMFCEGFYLHTLLVLAFFRSETHLLKGFYVFGWIGPIFPMIFYVYLRANDESDKSCWVEQSSWNHILSIPVCLCLVLSLCFLINILRVLVKKLKDNQKNFNLALRRNSAIGIMDNQHSLKKAVRATLILIPLLGLHYLLIPFRPDPGSNNVEAIYEVVAAATSSLQGFCVALLFCFCNSEVVSVFRRRCCPKMFEDKSPTNRADNSCAPTSMSIVVMKSPSVGTVGSSKDEFFPSGLAAGIAATEQETTTTGPG